MYVLVVVMDDFMCGVDIGIKIEVYDMICYEVVFGCIFLWYLIEMDEICNCDWVFVFCDGVILVELQGQDIIEEVVFVVSFEFGDYVE